MNRDGTRRGLRKVVIAGVVLAALLPASCGDSDDDETGGAASVVATTGILADLTDQVAGPDAEVVQLIPDGSDPHTFSMSAEDRLELEQADLVAANGAGLEGGVPLDELDAPVWELVENAGEPLPAAEDTHVDEEEHDGEEEHDEDPHVWMDPTRVAEALPALADALAEADPANAERYRQRAAEYAERLLALDREIDRALRPIPPPDRELVTSHDSLAYFADGYGFDVVATAFPATGAEAEVSAERLADVEAAVRETGVPAIFAQEGDDPEVLTLVAQDTGVDLVYGLLVETPGSAGTYEEMLRSDAELLSESLAP
jgi:zinc/manganese transport system substrate-binding protein